MPRPEAAWSAVALAAPGCLLAAASAVALILAAFDRYPMWPHQPTNLAEAAVAADDGQAVGQLLANGALMDTALWIYLRCIAEGDEVPQALDRYRPAGALLRCDGVTPPWPADGDR